MGSLKQSSRIGRLLPQPRTIIVLSLAVVTVVLVLANGARSYTVWLGSIALGLCFSFVALGVYLSFRVMDYPDLTIDGSLPLGAAISSALIVSGVDPFVSIMLAILAGAAAGMTTAIIATRLNIHSLLASILTTTSLFSINLRIMGQSNIPLLSERTVFSVITDWLGDTPLGQMVASSGSSTRVLLAILLFGLLAVSIKFALDWFLHTETGLALRATGDNPQMIRALGVNTDRMYVLGLAISNALVALSGSLLANFQGFSDVNIGQGLIIAGLAAVIIGETMFRPATLAVATTAVAVGMIIYRVVIAAALSVSIPVPGLGHLRIQAQDIKVATALLVILFLWSTYKRTA